MLAIVEVVYHQDFAARIERGLKARINRIVVDEQYLWDGGLSAKVL